MDVKRVLNKEIDQTWNVNQGASTYFEAQRIVRNLSMLECKENLKLWNSVLKNQKKICKKIYTIVFNASDDEASEFETRFGAKGIIPLRQKFFC